MHRVRYDGDWDRLSTASNPVGMENDYGKNYRPTIRRTSSVDDVSRYHRYFGLLRKHHGKRFTWKFYADLLYQTIYSYKTPDVPRKTATCSPAYVTAFERASWAPEQEMQSQGLQLNNKYRNLANHTLRPSSQSGSYVCVTNSERSNFEVNQERQPEKPSIRSRCRDIISRASPSRYGSPSSSFSAKKLSSENKGLVRDISQTIDRISKMARKKSNKQVKHLVHTINRNGYTPVSSGYSSSEIIEGSSSGSVASVRTPLTPIRSSSSGKRVRTCRKKNALLNYAY